MGYELFEFLTIYFGKTYRESQKKKFINWLSGYLKKQCNYIKQGCIFKNEGSKRLLIFNYQSPEKQFFGKEMQTALERKRYITKILRIKIIFLVLSAVLFFILAQLLSQKNWMFFIPFLLIFIITYVLGIGIPKKMSLSHTATMSTVLEIFKNESIYDLLLIDNEFISNDIINLDSNYEEIIFIKNLYISPYIYIEDQTTKNNIKIKIYFSGERSLEDSNIKLANINKIKDEIIPKKIFISLEELNDIGEFINKD